MPLFGDATYYYGNPAGFVAWDAARVFRTDDILAASPVWELIDTGIDGDVQDGQVQIGADGSVVMWLMTTTAIWRCADIKAVSPVWVESLTIETVRASDATPVVGDTVFKCMATKPGDADYCIVATGPLASDSANETYIHAYFWRTSDGGDNWAQSDYTGVDSGGRPYCYASLFGMAVLADGTVWCVRVTPRPAAASTERVLKSTDGGATWSVGADFNLGINNNLQFFSLLGKRSGGTNGYAAIGPIGTTQRPVLERTTDDWATFSTLTSDGDPTGYGGLSNLWRIVRVDEASEHLLAWFRHSAEQQMHLLESEDGGDTWTLVYDSGLADGTIVKTPSGSSVNTVRYCAPVAWPPDPTLWVLVRGAAITDDLTTQAVQLTDDYFTSLDDKEGNLAALLGTWTAGVAGGLFLPNAFVEWSEYAIGDGHNAPAASLTALTPQPSSAGVKVTRRPHSVSGGLQDEYKYVEYVYSGLGSVAEFQAVLTAFGVLNALQNEITVTARDETLQWVRFNGTAVRPQQGVDVSWNRYFPRDIVILVKEIEAAS